MVLSNAKTFWKSEVCAVENRFCDSFWVIKTNKTTAKAVRFFGLLTNLRPKIAYSKMHKKQNAMFALVKQGWRGRQPPSRKTMSSWGHEYLPLASGNSDFLAYASIFLRKTVGNARSRLRPVGVLLCNAPIVCRRQTVDHRDDRVVPRASRCWRSGLHSTDPTKSIWI